MGEFHGAVKIKSPRFRFEILLNYKPHIVMAVLLLVTTIAFAVTALLEKYSTTPPPESKTLVYPPSKASQSESSSPALDRRRQTPSAEISTRERFEPVITAVDGVNIVQNSVRLSVPAVGSVTVRVTPIPDSDLKVGVYVKPGQNYGYKLTGVVNSITPGLFTVDAVQFRAATSLTSTRGTLRVVVTRALRETPSDEDFSMAVLGLGDFRFETPPPNIEMTHVCGKLIAARTMLPQCVPLMLAGTSSQILGPDQEKLCIEVLASNGPNQSVVLLYGSQIGDGWAAVATDWEGLPKAERYTFRFGLVPPSHQAKTCEVEMQLLRYSGNPATSKTASGGPRSSVKE